jgi:hypothetical protein
MDRFEQTEKKQSYVGQALTGIFDLVVPAEKSTSPAVTDTIASQARNIAASGDGAYVASAGQVPGIVEQLHRDQQRLKLEQEISTYGAGFLKTATLFLRGRAALPLAMTVYGLDEAKPGDALGTQILDGALGAGKGAGMRAAFSLTHGIGDIAAKGMTLGIASRATEVGLTRTNYINPETGAFSMETGLRNLQQGVFNKNALAFDVITFGASAGVIGAANRASGGAIGRSPFVSTMLTGTTFGITGGGLEELSKQTASGNIDLAEITKRALIRGALDTVAAIPGGLQARHAYRPSLPAEQPLLAPALRPAKDGTTEALSSIKFTREMATGSKLAELTAKLSAPESAPMKLLVENPNRPQTFRSEADFLQNGVRYQEVPGRIYRFGQTEIAAPEAYAAKFDAVRQYRSEIAGKSSAEQAQIAQRVLGEDAHLAKIALPEDFLPAIEMLPDRRIGRINLLDIKNPEDIWVQQQGNSKYSSTAVVEPNGDVTFFRKQHDIYLHSDLGHEWAHLLRDSNPKAAAAFDLAASRESNGYMNRPHAGKNNSENFAVHLGEEFLHPDRDVFINLTREAPMRSVAMAQALRPVVFGKNDSPHAQMYRERVEYVEREVWPTVQRQLAESGISWFPQ